MGLSDMSAEDLNARENAHGGDTEEANASLDQARDFLRDLLKNGPMLVQEINDRLGKLASPGLPCGVPKTRKKSRRSARRSTARPIQNRPGPGS